MSEEKKKTCTSCKHFNRNCNIGFVGGGDNFYCKKLRCGVGTGASEYCDGKEWEERNEV